MKLTNKMRTSVKVSPACKLWLPYNEGSGNVHTSLVGNVAHTTGGTTYATPHTATLTDSAADSGSTLTIGAGKTILMFYGVIPTSFATFHQATLGVINASNPYIGFNSINQFIINDNELTDYATTGMAASTVTERTFVGAVVDGSTGNISCFESNNDAAMEFVETVAGTPLSTITPSITTALGMIINNTVAQPTYGVALWATSDSVTNAEALVWFEYMRKNWIVGRKLHHEAMYDLSA